MNRRFCPLAMLPAVALLAAAAWAQNASPDSHAAIPTVTFDRRWEQATPQNFTITVPSAGNANYTSSSPSMPADANGVRDEDYIVEFTMSAEGQEKVFRLAQEAGYFNGDFEYKHPVANTGKKTLAFTDATRHFQTIYNYSENKPIQELTAIFQGISNTIEHGRKLQFLRRFDKLGLEAELKGMEDAADSQYLAELQIIAPMLKSIAQDTSILNIARQRARRLLARIGLE